MKRTIALLTVTMSTLAIAACSDSPDSPYPSTRSPTPSHQAPYYAPVGEGLCDQLPVIEVLGSGDYKLPDDPFTAARNRSDDESSDSWWRTNCTYHFRRDDTSSEATIENIFRIVVHDESSFAKETYESDLSSRARTAPMEFQEPSDNIPWDSASYIEPAVDKIAYEYYVLNENAVVFLSVQARAPDEADETEFREWLHDTVHELIAAVYEHLPRTTPDTPSPS